VLNDHMAACRAGDMLVVTKLDRLARSLPDARAILDLIRLRTREGMKIVKAKGRLRGKQPNPVPRSTAPSSAITDEYQAEADRRSQAVGLLFGRTGSACVRAAGF
jgi:DNA invertase Pin-like site-specific DNA recombinase